MESATDGSGHTYFEVGNIRITCIPNTWNDDPDIRIQAYKPEGGLFQGAELPVPSKEIAFDFLRAIHSAFEENGL
jgi:hypothetical protein